MILCAEYRTFISIFKGLTYLHGERHLVHRDIKPANLLVNLKGEPKITDFGISAGLENSVAMVCALWLSSAVYAYFFVMLLDIWTFHHVRVFLIYLFDFQCATFVGTVTYMSPERIRNESYSYPADIWSLGLALFECGTGEFPYSANEGPVNLMLQVWSCAIGFPINPFFFKSILPN